MKLLKLIKEGWFALSISKKIGLTLAILVAGYLLIAIMAIVQNRQTDTRLGRATSYLLPATLHSQTALSTFNDQLKLYEDAILVGDLSLIELGQDKANLARQSLADIGGLEGIGAGRKRNIEHTLQELADFSARAKVVYPAMSTADMEGESAAVNNQVIALGQRAANIRTNLDQYHRQFRSDLETELAAIGTISHRQQYVGTTITLAAIFLAILISTLLARLITRPIISLAAAAHNIARGEWDNQLSAQGNDEVAALTRAFSTMVLKVQKRERSLRHNISSLKTINGERRKAEKSLRSLQNYLKNIIDSMPSVLVGVDSEGCVTQWNKEAAEQTGISPEEARSCLLSNVLPQLAGEMERVKEAIANRQVAKDSRVASHEQGGARYTDITIYPLIANGVEGAVIRMDDITDRVRIEEMMVQTEKMMSVGGLAAGMAHEINNPLAGIMQNLQVLAMYLNEDTPKNRRMAEEGDLPFERLRNFFAKREIPAIIESVMDSGKRAARIVDNMLSFSRKSEKGFIANDLSDLLDKTVELAANDYDLKKKYDFRQIEIVREYEDNLPEVFCEASQIQQVFLNILKNGAQAMAGENEELKINNAELNKSRFIMRLAAEADRGTVRIEIEDNGPGMDEETRKRVFEPFFTTKKVGTGTGLGMSVSYFIIVENHGGSMEVESSPGNDARFIIKLPLTRSE